jgi:DNA-binding GntR family transcriptional regulator
VNSYSIATRQRVRDAIANYSGIPLTSPEVREETGLSTSTVRQVLTLLYREGRLARRRNPFGPGFVYFVEES